MTAARILIAGDDVTDLVDDECEACHARLDSEPHLEGCGNDWPKPADTIECFWCGARVDVDDAVEGTCGGRDCLMFEGMDRRGLVP